MQGLANRGCAVIGIHNATEGMAKDLLECVLNKLNRGDTPSIDTLALALASALERGQPVRVVGHSQGALIVARALQLVSEALDQSGATPSERKASLGRIRIETFGGASHRYVDGPCYHHCLNLADLVPLLTGVGLSRYNPFCSVGEGAVIKSFVEAHLPTGLPAIKQGMSWWAARIVDRSTHGPRDVYWKHWAP